MTWALIQAMRLWADARYGTRLQAPGPMDDKWFRDFVGEWRVARTISTAHRRDILRYLNGPFRADLQRDKDGAIVTRAARHIANQGWTRSHHVTGSRLEPLSLVSKVAFFFQPARFVPFDSFGQKGLKKLIAERNPGGRGGMSLETYEKYLAAFNRTFEDWQVEIAASASTEWVGDVAKRLSCSTEVLRTQAFCRKVLDNILMSIGGRE